MSALQVSATVFLIAGGDCGLPLVLITLICSRKIAPRAVTLINFLLCWIVYSTAFLLLFYAGQQSGPEPHPIVCIIQAAMIHASGPLVAFAAFALVLQLLDDLYQISSGIHRIKSLRVIILLTVPWMLFMFAFIAILISGLSTPGQIFRHNSAYCTAKEKDALSYTIYAVTASALICTIAVEILVARKLRSHARALSSSLRSSLPMAFYHTLIRGAVFTLYCIIAVGMIFALIVIEASIAVFFFLCTLPLVVCLVFGTQRDLLGVWFAWLKIKPSFAPRTSVPTRIQVTVRSYPQSVTSPAEMYGGNENLNSNSSSFATVDCVV